MAEDLISSIIDNISVEAEIAKVETRLGELAATLKSFPKATVFSDASGTKELSSANRELSTVLDQLKVKNLELTNAIKQQQLVARQAAAEQKAAAAAKKEADAQATAAAKQRAIAEKEAATQAQIAGQEKIRALQAQQKAEEELIIVQKERAQTDIGTYSIPANSGQSGNSGIVKPVIKEAAFIPANDTEANLLFLTQTERQLKANQAAQKDLETQLKSGTITQAKYDEQVVAARLAESEYRKQIQLTTTELRARTNADFAIQGSIDAAKAQNAILVPQRNSIPVGEAATPEDIASLKALNAEIDKNNELIDKNTDLLGRQKINIGNYPNAFGGAFKTLNTELDAVQGKLVSGNFKGAAFDELTAKLNVLQNATALTGKTFTTVAQQQKAYAEASTQIGLVYGKNSDVFKQFSAGVKEGNVNVKGLASEVSAVTSKGSGFMGFLSGAYNGIRKLAYAIPGIGIGGLILLMIEPIQALGAELVKMLVPINRVKIAFETMGNVNIKAIEIFNKQTTALQESISILNDSSISLKDRHDELDKLIAQSPDYLRGLTLENLNTDDGRKILDAYNESLRTKGELQAAQSVNEDANKQLATLNVQKQSILSIMKTGAFEALGPILKDINDKIKAATIAQSISLNIYKEKFKENLTSGKESVKGLIEDLQAKISDLQKIQPTLLTPEAITANVAQIKKLQDEIDKLLGKTKNQKDSERLADDFRKKDLEALAKYTKDELDMLKVKYKTEIDDQNSSMEQRMQAAKDYYAVSAQLVANQIKDQEDALNLEVQVANKRAAKITDPKKRADAEIAIEKYRVDKLKTIQQDAAVSTSTIEKELYSQEATVAEQGYAKIQKAAEDAYKTIAAQAKIAFQNQKDTIDITKDEKLLQLEKDYAAGRIKTVEEYNQKKLIIENAADIQQKELDLKRIQEQEIVFEALYGTKNLSLIKAAKDIELQIEQEGNDKIKASAQKLSATKTEFANKLKETLQSIVENSFDASKNNNDAKLSAIDAQSQKEIDAINASGLAQVEKDRQIMAIQKQADFQKQQIEKRQQQSDIARAKFEKAASVISISITTAEAVAKITAAAAVARATYGAIPGVGLALGTVVASSLLSQIPFVVGTGLLEIAAVLSKPIPHFKGGTENAPKGVALVSEEGPELMIDRAGKMFLTPQQPSLIDLAGGEKIFKHDITKDLLSHYNLLDILQKAQSSKEPAKIDNGFNEKIYRELRSLNGKPPFIINVQNGMETSDYYMRNIKN